jgi:hypothetical protein
LATNSLKGSRPSQGVTDTYRLRVIGYLAMLTRDAKKSKVFAVQVPDQHLERDRAGDTHDLLRLSLHYTDLKPV